MMALLIMLVAMYMIGFGTCYFYLNRDWKQDIKAVCTSAWRAVWHKIEGK